MNCSLVRYLLELRRSSTGPESSDADREIRKHLDSCPDCMALAKREEDFDRIVQNRIQRVEVPSDFRLRLMERLRPVSHPAKPPKSTVRIGWVLAATLLLGVGFGAGLVVYKIRPTPITDHSWNRFWDDCFAWESSPPDRDQVAGWYYEMGVSADLPQDVNYQHLVSHGLVLWDGRPVPQLVFANPGTSGGRPSIAKVLVLSSKSFRLETLFPLPPNQEGSKSKLDILPESNEKSVFLVSHAGEGLDWLMTTSVSAALEQR